MSVFFYWKALEKPEEYEANMAALNYKVKKVLYTTAVPDLETMLMHVLL